MPVQATGGLLGPATPMPTAHADTAAVVRAAHLAGSTERHMLPAPRTVFDQAGLECCVSCALTAATEIKHPGSALAAIFHYHAAKYNEPVFMPGGRMSVDDGFNTLVARGVCLQSLHSAAYTAAGWASVPPQAAYSDALNRRLPTSIFSAGYYSLTQIPRSVEIRDRLRLDRPVIIGFALPQGYPASVPGPSNIWDNVSVQLSPDLHVVVAIGFDDMKMAIKVQDSRGNTAFDSGCWWMGYNVADSSIVSLAYTFA
jgi:hypothetical protein